MKHIPLAAALFALPFTAFAKEVPPKTLQTPGEIVAASQPEEWIAISPDDLLVMDIAPDAKGKSRRVIIQLMPAPFSQGWVGNIRKLAAAHWWDGTAIVRVQDNYVVQWGDPDGEDLVKAKKLPEGLVKVPESDYVAKLKQESYVAAGHVEYSRDPEITPLVQENKFLESDPYSRSMVGFILGWPVGSGPYGDEEAWPIHCYGMVGVGRNSSPDTGTGAELYTVIGHAPRQLDRNIALVGRVISGIEHITTLPRGTETLGFYKTAEERVMILSIRLASTLPADQQPRFEYLSTSSDSFAHYANKRANRKDDFYIQPAGGVDICNVPVPIREQKPSE